MPQPCESTVEPSPEKISTCASRSQSIQKFAPLFMLPYGQSGSAFGPAIMMPFSSLVKLSGSDTTERT